MKLEKRVAWKNERHSREACDREVTEIISEKSGESFLMDMVKAGVNWKNGKGSWIQQGTGGIPGLRE